MIEASIPPAVTWSEPTSKIRRWTAKRELAKQSRPSRHGVVQHDVIMLRSVLRQSSRGDARWNGAESAISTVNPAR